MIDLRSYGITDPFFGPPYIDVDEERDKPVPHRHLHGGFEGTDTRFRFYFPPAQGGGYEGRMFNPLSGANGGNEDFFGNTELGAAIGGIEMVFRLGGYMVESNQGHIGDEMDLKAGDDASLYGHRASAEVARLSKFVAAQIYGSPPHHSYVFGGSGGGRRSPLCLENAQDAWDGAVPFMGSINVAVKSDPHHFRRFGMTGFASMFNVQRILGDKLADVVDATSAGGSGDPFVGLTTHQREELVSLYRQGYPRGDEYMIGEPMGQMWLWTAMADELAEQDPDYFENFWTKPGYVGFDLPQLISGDLIDTTVTVSRVLRASDLLENPDFSGPDFERLRTRSIMMAQGQNLPLAVELKGLGPGYRLGTGVRVVSGKAEGRQLYCMAFAGDVLFCDGRGAASNLRFTDVLPGDEVHVDNRRFLAFCYLPRHDLGDELTDSMLLDGRPFYPSHSVPLYSPFVGVAHSGDFRGKMIYVQHTHDSSLWPAQVLRYLDRVLESQGEEGAAERFALRWTQNAEHVPANRLSSAPGRATNTWLVDYAPIIEQTLQDLADWVERGIEPAINAYEYSDGHLLLADDAAERGGIQPVVSVRANGATRAEVKVGEEVTLEVHAEVPPGSGSVISAEWDFDGSGTFPFKHEVDGTSSKLTFTTTHVYERPGTYFATALVHSHREGDVNAVARRIPNLSQARVVVW